MKRTLILMAGAVGFAAGLASCSREASNADAPGTTWRSMEALPDFSGWWEWQYTDEYQARAPDGSTVGLPQIMRKAPLKPEVVQFVVGTIAKVQAATGDREELFGASTVCMPPVFMGANGNPFNKVEILFTPGRVTIADEMGMVRRVNLGRALPTQIVESNTGTSVGHWEGDTFVIETAGINPDRTFAITPFKVGKGIHIVERIRLKEPDLLEIAVDMTAPELLTAPFKDTLFYKRHRDYTFIDANTCAADDRSIDHKAHKEQLDLTPPDDLPPPPP
jgi:hypothetical protein